MRLIRHFLPKNCVIDRLNSVSFKDVKSFFTAWQISSSACATSPCRCRILQEFVSPRRWQCLPPLWPLIRPLSCYRRCLSTSLSVRLKWRPGNWIPRLIPQQFRCLGRLFRWFRRRSSRQRWLSCSRPRRCRLRRFGYFCHFGRFTPFPSPLLLVRASATLRGALLHAVLAQAVLRQAGLLRDAPSHANVLLPVSVIPQPPALVISSVLSAISSVLLPAISSFLLL